MSEDPVPDNTAPPATTQPQTAPCPGSPTGTRALLLQTNTRDKLLILAMTWLATLSLVLAAWLLMLGKIPESVTIAALAINIGGVLGGSYRGHPSPSDDAPKTNGS